MRRRLFNVKHSLGPGRGYSHTIRMTHQISLCYFQEKDIVFLKKMARHANATY